MSDGHPCSTCPILDLGHKYPVGDQRDPWRRMPKLWKACRVLFGGGMANHTGLTRLRLEKLFGHYCKVQRSKYGPCTMTRARVCAGILQDAVAHGHKAPDQPRKYAYVTQQLRRVVNDDDTDALMKTTIVRPPTPDLAMPPVTFREVPAA